MDVDPAHEGLFNEVYDTEHVPALMEVPGVLSVARCKTQELTMVIGGERRTVVVEDEPVYSAQYEIESPEVLTSDGWGEAVERGRWPHFRGARGLAVRQSRQDRWLARRAVVGDYKKSVP